MSTFTTNKNLEQVARGADIGTWDTPTNSNWGIVDSGFGGVTTVALTNSPVTLSAGQYQCTFISFTGALSGSVAITFPPVGSFYTIQNLTTNTSNFQVTLLTTVGGGQTIGCPWGEPFDIFTDGTNVKFKNLDRVGGYWDFCGSSVPAWVTACTVPPYLNCDGTAFSSATYPILTTILGGNTLPDSKGRMRLTLDQGAGRVSSGISGVAGNTLLAAGGDQSLQSHNHTATSAGSDSGHVHAITLGNPTGGAGGLSQGTNGGIIDSVGTTAGFANITVTTTVNNTGSGGSQNMPPVYVGGLTLIRSA